MDDINLTLVISIIAPMLMMLFVFRGNSRKVLIFMIIGMIAALFSGEINSVIFSVRGGSAASFAVSISPIIEEVIKAFPIVFFALFFKPQNQLMLECASALGVGFAVLENALVFAGTDASGHLMLALFRGLGAGMLHVICMLIIGYGMVLIGKSRKMLIPGMIAMLSVTVILHSTYNIVVQSKYSILGIAIPLLIFIPLLRDIHRQRLANKNEQQGEQK